MIIIGKLCLKIAGFNINYLQPYRKTAALFITMAAQRNKCIEADIELTGAQN
jgi:hypothetical protein